MLKLSLLFWLLVPLTGNPLLALLLLALGFWFLDRRTMRLLPDFGNLFARHNLRVRLRRELEVNPEDADARLELARLLVEAGSAAEALDQVERAMPKLQGVAEAHFLHGLVLLRAARPREAILSLETSRSLEPALRSHEALLRLGEAHAALGDHPPALVAFDRFLEEHAGSVEGRVLAARERIAAGDRTAARAHLDAAIEAWRSSPLFRRRLDRRWSWRARSLRRTLSAR